MGKKERKTTDSERNSAGKATLPTTPPRHHPPEWKDQHGMGMGWDADFAGRARTDWAMRWAMDRGKEGRGEVCWQQQLLDWLTDLAGSQGSRLS